MATHIANGHAAYAKLGKYFFHGFKPGRLDDRF
jgi:hypothetical protein